MKKAQYGVVSIILFIFFLLSLIICLLGFDMVDASHIGVMNRFGEIKGVMEPGIRWTGLFTNVYSYDLRTRPVTIELTPSDSSATKDGQSIYAVIKINWRLKPQAVENIYRHVGKDSQVYDVLNIEGKIKHGFKTVTVQYNDYLDILQHRDEVIDQAVASIKERFPNEYAELEYIVIQNIMPTASYQDQIDAKKTAQQEALKSLELVKVKEAEASMSVASAEGEKQVRIKQADAEKYEIIARAEAQAQSIEIQGRAEALALGLKRKELTPLMVQNNWVDAWMSGGAQVPKMMMGSDAGGNFLYQLPISEELN